MRKLVITALITAAAAMLVAAPLSASTRTAGGERDIVTTAVAAGQFKTLVSLVKKAGLASTLRGPGAFTVFAPTDAAFKKVPKKTLAALARNKAKLRAVLLYHVVPGAVTSKQVVTLKSAKTLNGKSVAIRVSGMNVFVNNAKVVKADVMATNGVIHVVNRVLIPPAR